MRVTRWTGVFDAGWVINAKTTASQLRGAVVMGIGIGLEGETLLGPRTGRVMNASLPTNTYQGTGTCRRSTSTASTIPTRPCC